QLILCTSSGGFFNDHKELVTEIKSINSEILSYIRTDKSSVGLGGMLSKITFTQLATSLGIEVFMTGLDGNEPLQKTLEHEKGSYFHAARSTLKARQKWLMSGSVTTGEIVIDAGAEKALHARKSLLTVGIKKVSGTFTAGQVVQLITEHQSIAGVAKTRLSHLEIEENIKTKNCIAAHANDIVLF
ncbi:MAG: PUA domain-containing protein, partial [Chitinophagaceae bacterium]